MVKCGSAGMQDCSLGLVGLGFRVRDKVRVSVRDRVGVRVSDGVRVLITTSPGLTKSQPHDRTRPHSTTTTTRPSCAVVLVEHDRKQSTGVQSSGPRTCTQVLHARDVWY